LTGLIIILSLIASREFPTEPWDLMETSSTFFWSSGTAMGGRTTLLFDGEPVVLLGDPGLPPWDSFAGVTQYNPLEGGLWSSCRWSLDFKLPEIPDSTYESKVGLLENTSGRNGYTGFLRRPLPGGLLLGLSIGREDTFSSQRVRLLLGRLDFTARLRQGDADRYMLSTGWSDGNGLRIRSGFARMYHGGRQLELFGSMLLGSEVLSFEAGIGGSWLSDSLLHGELHVLSRMRPGVFTLTGRADLTDNDGEFNLGGAGGCMVHLGPLELQTGVYAAPGDDPALLLQADAGPATARLVLDGKTVAAGGDLCFSVINLLAKGSFTAWESDSAAVAGLLLPSVRYWNAWIRAGARCDLRWAEGVGWEGSVDILSAFTLGRFAMLFAVENVDDDLERNWTYGISWEFTDRPPSVDTGEEDDRGGGEG
jgi:hypothetical protein